MKENCFQLYWDTTEILFFTIFVKAAVFPCFDPVVPYHRKRHRGLFYLARGYQLSFQRFVCYFSKAAQHRYYRTGRDHFSVVCCDIIGLCVCLFWVWLAESLSRLLLDSLENLTDTSAKASLCFWSARKETVKFDLVMILCFSEFTKWVCNSGVQCLPSFLC